MGSPPPPSNAVLVTMKGIGDSIYASWVVNELLNHYPKGFAPYVQTPWPQLFSGIARPVKCITSLRVQAKNLLKYPSLEPLPEGVPRFGIGYNRFESAARRRETSILETLEARAGVVVKSLGLFMDRQKKPASNGARPVVVHYPTLRSEWPCKSRNPIHGAMKRAVEVVAGEGDVISIADVDGETETFVEPESSRPANVRFERGELGLHEIANLLEAARVVVTSVSFVVPMAAALGVPCIVLFGGYAAKSVIVDRRMSAPGNILCIAPERECNCLLIKHECYKILRSGWENRVERWMERMVTDAH